MTAFGAARLGSRGRVPPSRRRGHAKRCLPVPRGLSDIFFFLERVLSSALIFFFFFVVDALESEQEMDPNVI